jgi:hypothetical protein
LNDVLSSSLDEGIAKDDEGYSGNSTVADATD